jgi:hypothetical protein
VLRCRDVVIRIPFMRMIPTFMIITLTLFPLLASADEDLCRETGIYVMNHIGQDLSYTRNGDCYRWKHTHRINVKPEDKLIIYRNTDCTIEYFSKNPTYDDYKPFDTNQNCIIRFLFDRTFGDL